MNSNDVGVIEGGEGFRFTLEPGAALFVLGELVGQDLDRPTSPPSS